MSLPPPRYWAFLSYSHRDEKAARALHTQIETYRLPSRLVGQQGAHGALPRQLKPLFRDRDELHAGADLSAKVSEALAASRWLIVLCSPAAANSQWVEREITSFKRLHGEARVLACILSGEPFASRLPGREAEECFPRALRHALGPSGEADGAALEPLAADLRKGGDGKRAALKLIAGMLGVGYDELARREAQRRQRIASLISLAALAGMAVLGVLSVLAYQARNEAQRQRAQAEDLVEFMLVDLRKKLDPVGRLDVLDAVGDKALAYYASRPAHTLDATALGHRARALHLIGEINEQRGSLSAALTAFESAADTTAQLLALAPQDAQRIFNHAQSEYWVGYVAWKRKEFARAATHMRNYLSLAEQLQRIDANNSDYQAELGYAHSNLGTVLIDLAQPEAAVAAFDKAIAVFTPLSRQHPERLENIAELHGWAANAYLAMGQLDAAEAQQNQQLALFLAQAQGGKDRNAQRGTLLSQHALARLALARGHYAAALAKAQAALQRGEALTAADPANHGWLTQHALSLATAAQAAHLLGQGSTARAYLARAQTAYQALQGLDASDPYVQVGLAGWVTRLQCELASNNAANSAARSASKAAAQCTEALQHYRAQALASAAQGRGFQLDALLIFTANALQLGDHLQAQGKSLAARALWQDSAARLAQAGAARHLGAQALRARCLLRLGDSAAAQGLAQALQAGPLRGPDYHALQHEIAASARGTTGQATPPRPAAATMAAAPMAAGAAPNPPGSTKPPLQQTP